MTLVDMPMIVIVSSSDPTPERKKTCCAKGYFSPVCHTGANTVGLPQTVTRPSKRLQEMLYHMQTDTTVSVGIQMPTVHSIKSVILPPSLKKHIYALKMRFWAKMGPNFDK